MPNAEGAESPGAQERIGNVLQEAIGDEIQKRKKGKKTKKKKKKRSSSQVPETTEEETDNLE